MPPRDACCSSRIDQPVAIEGVLLERLVFAQELDRDRPALEARVLRTPHLAHGPGTKAVDELIAAGDDDVPCVELQWPSYCLMISTTTGPLTRAMQASR